MTQDYYIMLGGKIATQAFALTPESKVREFMDAVGRRFQDDNGYHIWFQMEPESEVMWAVMHHDYWQLHADELCEMSKKYDLVPTEM